MPWTIITKGSLPKELAYEIANKVKEYGGFRKVFKSKDGYHVLTYHPIKCQICRKAIKNLDNAILSGEKYIHIACLEKAGKSFFERL